MNDLASNYVSAVPVPQFLVGKSLFKCPELSQSGMNVLSRNFQVEDPKQLATTALQPKDVLLCSFSQASNSQQVVQSLQESTKTASKTTETTAENAVSS